MNELLKLCIFCTLPVGYPPLPDKPREVGDIVYRHEVLYGTHMLRLSSTDLIIDTEDWRARRLFAFATNFAEATCGPRFQMIKAVRQTTTTAQFSFRCK